MTIHPIPVLGEFQTLTYHTNKKKAGIASRTVLMSYLTEEEEKALDEGNKVKLIRKDLNGKEYKFVVSTKSTFGYGEVNLNNGSDDAELVDKFKILENLDFCGYPIPVFDYHHSELLGGWFATWSPLTVCQYAHCKLGKPKRIIIFRK